VGIIVGFFAFALAVGALVLAWPLGLIVGGYRRAAFILAALLGLTGVAVAVFVPIVQNKPETAIWPMALGGGGLLVAGLLFYATIFASILRWVRQRRGR